MNNRFEIIAELPRDLLLIIFSKYVSISDFKSFLILMNCLKNTSYSDNNKIISLQFFLDVSTLFFKNFGVEIQNTKQITEHFLNMSLNLSRPLSPIFISNHFLLQLSLHQIDELIVKPRIKSQASDLADLICAYVNQEKKISDPDLFKKHQDVLSVLYDGSCEDALEKLKFLNKKQKFEYLAEYFARIRLSDDHAKFMQIINNLFTLENQIEFFSYLMLNPSFMSGFLACHYFLNTKTILEAAPFIESALQNPFPNLGLYTFIKIHELFSTNTDWIHSPILDSFDFPFFANVHAIEINYLSDEYARNWYVERNWDAEFFEHSFDFSNTEEPQLWENLYIMLYKSSLYSGVYDNLLEDQEDILEILHHPENEKQLWHANYLTRACHFYKNLTIDLQTMDALSQKNTLKKLVEGFRLILNDSKINLFVKLNIVVILYSLEQDFNTEIPELSIFRFLYRALHNQTVESVFMIRNISCLILESGLIKNSSDNGIIKASVISKLYDCLKKPIIEENEYVFSGKLWNTYQNTQQNFISFKYILNTLLKYSPTMRYELFYHLMTFLLHLTQNEDEELLKLDLSEIIQMLGVSSLDINEETWTKTPYQLLTCLFQKAQQKKHILPLTKRIIIEDRKNLVSEMNALGFSLSFQNTKYQDLIYQYIECAKYDRPAYSEILRATLNFFHPKNSEIKIDSKTFVQPLKSLLFNGTPEELEILSKIVSMKYNKKYDEIVNLAYELADHYLTIPYQKLSQIISPNPFTHNIEFNVLITNLHDYIDNASSDSINQLYQLMTDCRNHEYHHFIPENPIIMMNTLIRLLDQPHLDSDIIYLILERCIGIDPTFLHINPQNIERIYQFLDIERSIYPSLEEYFVIYFENRINQFFTCNQEMLFDTIEIINQKNLEQFPNFIHQKIELLFSYAIQSKYPAIQEKGIQFKKVFDLLERMSSTPCLDFATFNHRINILSKLFVKYPVSQFHILKSCLIYLLEINPHSKVEILLEDFGRLIQKKDFSLSDLEPGNYIAQFFHKICQSLAYHTKNPWTDEFIQGLLLDIYAHPLCTQDFKYLIMIELQSTSDLTNFRNVLKHYPFSESIPIAYSLMNVVQPISFKEFMKQRLNFLNHYLLTEKFTHQQWLELIQTFSLDKNEYESSSSLFKEMLIRLKNEETWSKKWIEIFDSISNLKLNTFPLNISEWLRIFNELCVNYYRYKFYVFKLQHISIKIIEHISILYLLNHETITGDFKITYILSYQRIFSAQYPTLSVEYESFLFFKHPHTNTENLTYQIDDNFIFRLILSLIQVFEDRFLNHFGPTQTFIYLEILENLFFISQKLEHVSHIQRFILTFLAVKCNQFIEDAVFTNFSIKMKHFLQQTPGFLQAETSLQIQIIHYFRTKIKWTVSDLILNDIFQTNDFNDNDTLMSEDTESTLIYTV